MALYTAGARSIVTTTLSALAEIRAGASRPLVVRSISFAQSGTLAGDRLGLGRPAAIGVTPTGPTFQAVDPAMPAASAQLATGWATAPTAPTVFLRMSATLNQTGILYVWTFGRLVIPVSGSLVLWHLQAGSALDVVVDLEE